MDKNILFLLIAILCIASVSCETEKKIMEEGFYFYDFESDYTNIDSAYIGTFDGNKKIGPFNNDGFSLHFEDLPEHDYIRLRFDLFIHDSWEGNTNNTQAETPDHDAWLIELDPQEKNPWDQIKFETTFSNGLCIDGWCYGQSYPNQYPFHNEARVGSRKSTFGRCLYKDSPMGTSVYSIDKVFPHTRDAFVFVFYDQLKQDGPFDPLCEESWSMDNLDISLLSKK